MNRAPFVIELVSRLDRVHDGGLFEQCACSLLSAWYPDLVPLPGGADSGMDGSLETGKAFLIATTSRDLIGNVTGSLQSHLKSGLGRRRVVVVTSRRISNPARQKVEKRVLDMGFDLIGFHEQSHIADLLYHSPRWCKELLDLPGQPFALASVPRGARPFQNVSLVGRASELEWLRTTPGDRLIVGQPGIGKTFLTRQLVGSGALFAIQDDSDRLAESFRSTCCETVIVENAHAPEGRRILENLCHLRELCGFRFDIVADCWPRAAKGLMAFLRISPASVLTMKPLDPKGIVELLGECGIHGPAILLSGVVRQTRGFPGRAAWLAHFLRTGDIDDVWSGEALSRMTKGLENLVQPRSFRYLALFALGGDHGVSMKLVAECMHTGLDEVHEALVELASGGVVEEVDDDRFCVVPERLRPFMIRDTFYRPPRLRVDLSAIEKHHPVEVVRAQLHARAAGADIPAEELFEKVRTTPSETLWPDFIHAGDDLAGLFALRRPAWSSDIARALLWRVPEFVLPTLLDKAIGDNRSTTGHTDHPLRLIEDWIVSAYPDCNNHVRRCELLLDALESWMPPSEGSSVLVRALRLVMTPRYETTEQDPGEWDRFTIIQGAVLEEAVPALAVLWPRVLVLLQETQKADWTPIWDMLRDWLHPGLASPTPNRRGHRRLFRQVVQRMISDLVPLACDHPAVLRNLRDKAAIAQVRDLPRLDHESAIIFPPSTYRDTWETDQARQHEAARGLGDTWAKTDPEEIASRMKWFRDETALAGGHQSSLAEFVVDGIARRTVRAIPWVDAFIDAGLGSPEIWPLLRKAALDDETGWKVRAHRCLALPGLDVVGARLLLQVGTPSKADVDAVVACGQQLAGAIRDICSYGTIDEPTIGWLLQCGQPALAAAAAIGLWHRLKEGAIPDGLRTRWIDVIVKHVEDDYVLREVAKADGEAALAILAERLQSPDRVFGRERDVLAVACGHLGPQQRAEFLGRLCDNSVSQDIAGLLVGSDEGLFRSLLARDDLYESVRLAPLGRPLDATWIELALVALDAGVQPESVASHSLHHREVFVGSLSDRAKGDVSGWEGLGKHPNGRIRLVAAAGLEQARADLRSALRFERFRHGSWPE